MPLGDGPPISQGFIQQPYQQRLPFIGDPIPYQPWQPTPNVPALPTAGRWKCPDCGSWVANWIPAHTCTGRSIFPNVNPPNPPYTVGSGFVSAPNVGQLMNSRPEVTYEQQLTDSQ